MGFYERTSGSRERIPELFRIAFRNRGSINLSAMMKAQAATSREEAAIKLKAITPRFPENKEEAMQLNQDLERMGCAQLRHKP